MLIEKVQGISPKIQLVGDNGVPRRLRSSFVTKVSERVGSICDLAD